MLTLKMIILGMVFIISGGAVFGRLFKEMIFLELLAGMVASVSFIYLVKDLVHEEMVRQAQTLPPVVVQSPAVTPVPKPAEIPVVTPVREPQPGETFQDRLKDGSLGPEMVQIPAGTFQMGSNDEKPVHTVSVKSFALGKYEATRGEFRKFVEVTGYKTEAEKEGWCYEWTGGEWKKNSAYNWKNVGFTQDDKHPVVCVSWNDAKAYVKWLSEQTGGKDYRLPSEAQWEYAVRAGSTSKYFWGNEVSEACRYANVADKKAKEKFPWSIVDCTDGYVFTSPVGVFESNKFGLYDMTGNVWEWLEDKWHSNYNGSPSDGSAWLSGDSNSHLLRGGSWLDNDNNLRCANRIRNNTTNRGNFRGFRISRM